jgi:hypothetical protein
MTVAVAIVAKAPRSGAVKTRLCPPLRPREAAALARCFLRDKIAQVRGLTGVTPVVAFTLTGERPMFERLASGFTLIPQRGPDLGLRLRSLLATLLRRGHRAALAIDSDTPTLPPDAAATSRRSRRVRRRRPRPGAGRRRRLLSHRRAGRPPGALPCDPLVHAVGPRDDSDPCEGGRTSERLSARLVRRGHAGRSGAGPDGASPHAARGPADESIAHPPARVVMSGAAVRRRPERRRERHGP